MTERGNGIVAGCVFIALGAFAYAIALTIPRRMPVGIDSGVLPEIFAAGLFVCGVLLAAFSLFAPLAVPKDGETPVADDAPPSAEPRRFALLLNIVLIIGYVATLRDLGFVVSSAIFFFLQISLLDHRGGAKGYAFRAAFAVVGTGLIWVLFEKGFGLILPSGILG